MSTMDAVVTDQRSKTWVAPVIGAVIYLVGVLGSFLKDRGEPAEQGFKEWAISFALAGVGVAVAMWAAGRAERAGSHARTAMILGIVSVATIMVFYLGFPCIFGATAIALGLQARRAGSSPQGAALVGIVLGAVALGFGAFIMVTG